MNGSKFNALFVCTGNSARSIMAEDRLNALGEGRFRADFAFRHLKGEVHPLAPEREVRSIGRQ